MFTKNINLGKRIRTLCCITSIIMFLIGNIIEYFSNQNEISNLRGSDVFAYELGVFRFHTPGIVYVFIISALIIYILGNIIGSILCRCNNCGNGVMSRYGSIYDYCPKCGRKIE